MNVSPPFLFRGRGGEVYVDEAEEGRGVNNRIGEIFRKVRRVERGEV